jgi:phage terminase small subunit
MQYLDDRSEAFAQALARGLPQSQAALVAGYSELTARKAAFRLARKPLIQARLKELGSKDATSASETIAPGCQALAAHEQAEPTRTQATEGALQRGRPQAVAQRVPDVPSARISTLSVPETRAWLLDLLGQVAEDACTVRDRRSAIAAASEIAKLNGLHTHRVEVATSVLDGFSAHELRGLQAALAAYDVAELVIDVPANEVLDGDDAVG